MTSARVFTPGACLDVLFVVLQEKLARDILEDYAKEEKTIHLLCVLKGSANFFQVCEGSCV